MTSTNEPIFAVCIRPLVVRSYSFDSQTPVVPRKRCVHCPVGSPAPGAHPCSSAATWSRPPCVRLARRVGQIVQHGVSYFMISLSLMIRLISWIIAELTHTIFPSQITGVVLRADPRTHFLCGSGSHCGSWSCWHIVQRHCYHLRWSGNRILNGSQRDGTQCQMKVDRT